MSPLYLPRDGPMSVEPSHQRGSWAAVGGLDRADLHQAAWWTEPFPPGELGKSVLKYLPYGTYCPYGNVFVEDNQSTGLSGPR